MKRLIAKTKGLVKGLPSGVLASILFHAIILVIAGIWGITVAIREEPPKFEPPPVVDTKTRPIKKPTVKQKKTKPAGGSTRIVSKNPLANTSFQLPEVSGSGKTGFGTGLGGGVAGFEMAPDLTFSLLGANASVASGNDLEGTFYSMNLDRQGRKTSMSGAQFITILKRFVAFDWSPNVFTPYYRSPNNLYATQIFIPHVSSEQGPTYFGVDPVEVEPSHWVALYTGKFKSQTGGKYRFRGWADDILMVRVNRKLVLNASGVWNNNYNTLLYPDWRPQETRTYQLDREKTPPVGDWFDLEKDKPAEIEIILGEVPGGEFASMLVIEEYGVDYPLNPAGGPILPIFKTAETPESVLEEIKYYTEKYKAEFDDCPLFNVY